MSDPPPRVSQPPRGARPIGLRGEAVILLPVATLLLVALSVFTLVSYRDGVRRIGDERRAEAERLARDVALALSSVARPSAEDLHRLAPFAQGALIATSDGAVLATVGDASSALALAPLGGRFPVAPVAVGPSEAAPVVSAFAPFGTSAARRFVRIDLATPVLAAQQRGLAPLTVVVVAADSGLLLLLWAFLYRALRPFDVLVARARTLGSGADEADDVAFLVAAFERALSEQARDGRPLVEDDIAALERALAPSLESGLLLLDVEGRLLALNPAGARLLGVDAAAALGLALEQALGRQRELAVLLRQAVTDGRPLQRAEVRAAVQAADAADGASGDRILGLSVHPMRRGDAAARGYLVLFADLTEARKREEAARLAQSLERIGELTAGLAHELRNGVATLRGYLTLIARRPAAEEVDSYLEDMRLETDHLHRILEDFLAFARPGTTRLEDVDLAAVVQRAANDPALGGAAIALEVPTDGSARLRADPQLLERAIRNLLHNAIEAQAAAARAAEPVTARVVRRGGELLVEVLDRGAGVPEAVRERLFEAFASERPGGVGLGLALTRRIVGLHGGTVEIEARAGGGTRATLRFPAE